MDTPFYNQLCNIELLREAWLMVNAKHSTGGIDAVSVEEFEQNVGQNLDNLLASLVSQKYVSMPMKKASCLKKDGSKRELGMLTVSDKIVQRAVKTIIEPQFEKLFLDVSYGYRPNKSPAKAVKRLLHYIHSEHRLWMVVCDINNCFDTIPHEPFLQRLAAFLNDKAIVGLIEEWIKMGRVSGDFKWTDSSIGLHQGAILSPLFTNFYLHPLDMAILAKKAGLVRYADDFVIACKTKEEADSMLAFSNAFLNEQLKLALNQSCKIYGSGEPFTFLGVTIRNGHVELNNEKLNILKTRITESFGIENSLPSEKFIQKLMGIKAYYGQILPIPELAKLDTALIECLVAQLQKAYNEKKLSNKLAIKLFVEHICFFDPQKEVIKKKIAQEVSCSCTRTIQNKKGQIRTSSSNRVLLRKRQFQKMESAGMELLVSTPGMQLGKSKGTIVLKKIGKVVKTVLANNLKNITITTNGINISSDVLRFCAEKGIVIDFLNYDGSPFAKLSTPKFAGAANEIAQIQALENHKATRLIKAIIRGKIKNQINTLKFFSRQRKTSNPDFVEGLPIACNKMELCLGRLKSVSEVDLDQARGKILAIEGNAASIYWDQVRIILQHNITFPGRLHQGATDLFNSMLNYGYAILYSRAWEAIQATRLNPCLGFLHVSEINRPSLVFDFVEEFRSAIVDRTAISIITKGEKMETKNGLLTDFSKKRISQKILEKLNKVEKFRSIERRIRDIIHDQANGLKHFLNGDIQCYKPYIKTW